MESRPRLLTAVGLALRRRCAVDVAWTAADTLERAAAWAPDLVLVDLGHRDVEGLCLLRALATRPRCCRLLVITDEGGPETVRDIATLRIDGVLRKPVSVDALLARIARALALPGLRIGRYVARAIAYLNEHYTERLTLGALARVVGVSASHLGNTFRDETGITVHGYVTEMRLSLAKQLLGTTDGKLEEIAQRVGFCDGPHLCRVFVERVGVRPGRYRRRARAAGDVGRSNVLGA